MTACRAGEWAAGLLAGLLLAGPVAAQSVPPYDRNAPTGEPPAVPGFEGQTGPEVLGRGPVHEAFAQPNGSATRAGPTAPKAPPQPVPELPSDLRPEGANVVWVPGYWSWDGDAGDWVWVSGFWRVAPPGRKWVPGYWAKTDSGWRYVSGFWADGRAREMPYLPLPPESLERGPSAPQPNDNSYYVPGTWVARDDRWLWQPGFWCPGYPGWVYTPARSFWTPGGALFVGPYWDYDVSRRGVLAPPVRFRGGFQLRPGFALRPTYALNTASVFRALWIGPGGSGYVFGDYYGNPYRRAGFQPWVLSGPRGGDPLFNHSSWANRRDRGWQTGLANLYQDRTLGNAARPPRTLADQQRLAATMPVSQRLIQPLTSYSADPLRLRRASGATAAGDAVATIAGAVRQRTETAPRPAGLRPAPLVVSGLSTTTTTRTRPIDDEAGRLLTTPRTGPRTSFYPSGTAARSTTTPRLTSPPPATPRGSTGRATTTTAPRTTAPTPRTAAPAPRAAAPAPRAPAPRAATPSAPRVTMPSAPRISVPSVPRVSVPAPRMSAPAGRASAGGRR